MGAATRGGPGNANAAAIVKPTPPGVVGRPPKPARVGAPPGPRETRWGLAPSEWTGDVGSELVTLQAAQNLALRREREKWEAERKRLEDAARAAGAPQYGRQAAPSPPPPSIPSSDDEDEETKAQSPKSPKPRGSNPRRRKRRRATPGGREMYRLKSSRPGLHPRAEHSKRRLPEEHRGARHAARGATVRARRPSTTCSAATKTRLRRWTEATRATRATRAIRARPPRRRARCMRRSPSFPARRP